MNAKKATPAKKAPTKVETKNEAQPRAEPKASDKPDEAGSADPASQSIARHPKGDE